jgi:hypothetical protein
LWFGERGYLPVWLTNQQPIRFLQLSFPYRDVIFGPGCPGPGFNLLSGISQHRHILFRFRKGIETMTLTAERRRKIIANERNTVLGNMPNV